MTEYNRLFREAFDRVVPSSDDKSFIADITERKNKMNNDGFEVKRLHEITVPHSDAKPRKAPWVAAAAGLTAAAAVLLVFFAGKFPVSNDDILIAGASQTKETQPAPDSAVTYDTADDAPQDAAEQYHDALIREKEEKQKEIDLIASVLSDARKEYDALKVDEEYCIASGADDETIESLKERIADSEKQIASLEESLSYQKELLAGYEKAIADAEGDTDSSTEQYELSEPLTETVYALADNVAEFEYNGYRVEVKGYEFDGLTMNMYYSIVRSEDNTFPIKTFAHPKITYFVYADLNAQGSTISESDDIINMAETVHLSGKRESIKVFMFPPETTGTVPEETREKYSFTAVINSQNVTPRFEKGQKITAKFSPAEGIQAYDDFSYEFTDFDLIVDHFDFDGTDLIAVYDAVYRNDAGIAPDNDIVDPRVAIMNDDGMFAETKVTAHRHESPNIIRYVATAKLARPAETVDIRLVDQKDINYPESCPYTAYISVGKSAMPSEVSDNVTILNDEAVSRITNIPGLKIRRFQSRYDGNIVKITLDAAEGDPSRLLIRAVTDPRTLTQNIYENSDGTYTLWALLDVPAGETELFEAVDISMRTDNGIEPWFEFSVTGTNKNVLYDYLSGSAGDKDRVLDELGYGDTTLDFIVLSPFGIDIWFNGTEELKLSGDTWHNGIKLYAKDGSEITYSGISLSSSYTIKDTWHSTITIVPDQPAIDLTTISKVVIGDYEADISEFETKR